MFSLLLTLSISNAQTIADCNTAPNGTGFGALFNAASCQDVCTTDGAGQVDCDFSTGGLFSGGVDAQALETKAFNGFDYTVFGMDNGPVNDVVCCLISNSPGPVGTLNLFGTDAADDLAFSSDPHNLDLGPSDANPLQASISGRNGADNILGSRSSDPDMVESLAGDKGWDLIRGRAGRDHIYGGEGFDDLFGGPGNDVICGSDTCADSNDQIGDDINGGNGDDVLCDADTLGDAHTMVGGTGVDQLWLEPLTAGGGGALQGGGFDPGSSCEPGGAQPPGEQVGGNVPGAEDLATGNCNSGAVDTTPPLECSFGIPENDYCVPPLSQSSLCN